MGQRRPLLALTAKTLTRYLSLETLTYSHRLIAMRKTARSPRKGSVTRRKPA
jgi:hypothetical protein